MLLLTYAVLGDVPTLRVLLQNNGIRLSDSTLAHAADGATNGAHAATDATDASVHTADVGGVANEYGLSPVHWSALYGHCAMVRMLTYADVC
jgi:hypothetical protein